MTGTDRSEEVADELSVPRDSSPVVNVRDGTEVHLDDRVVSADHARPSGSAPSAGVPVPNPPEVLGRIPTGTTLRTELAAAARSRGLASSFAAELSTLHESIEAIEIPSVDLEGARKRLAEATGEEERLKERVAATRGNVQGRREVSADAKGSLADLEEAAAALSAAQTERIAAEQALERARDRAAAARDERERRLTLRDRLDNRRRDARSELANATYPAFCEALPMVPNGAMADPGDAPSAYEGSSLAASFAAVRISEVDGPVVLGPDAATAFDRWDGPSPETALGVPAVRPDL